MLLRTNKLICCLLLVCLFTSCKKYLEVGPAPTDLTNPVLFADNGTATSAVLALYAEMENEELFWGIIRLAGLSSDELQHNDFSTDAVEAAANNLSVTNGLVRTRWGYFYKYIYGANAVLEGLGHSTGLTAPVRAQLRGEALFIRALCYSYLVQFWGGVPLVTGTAYDVNKGLARAAASAVYDLVLADLNEAAGLLTDDYKDASNNISSSRVRVNRGAVAALLARVQLLRGQWELCQSAADVVIGNSAYTLEPVLSDAFLIPSREAILQTQSVWDGYSSSAGYYLSWSYSVRATSLVPSFPLLFSASDKRLTDWIGTLHINGQDYVVPRKYRAGYSSGPKTEYTMILRLAEVYLARAEARAQLGDLPGAEADLNMIRSRAGIAPVAGLPLAPLLDSIHLERRRELFCEGGDRWLDLKRTGKADAVLSAVKGAGWQATDTLYPIPQSERLLNPTLTQNAGY